MKPQNKSIKFFLTAFLVISSSLLFGCYNNSRANNDNSSETSNSSSIDSTNSTSSSSSSSTSTTTSSSTSSSSSKSITEVANLSGYYASANGLNGYPLKTALYNIISKNTTVLDYTDLRYHFEKTDKRSDGKVWDIYSHNPNGTSQYNYTFSNIVGEASSEGKGWNREHTFPKSWFMVREIETTPMYSDIFHLYPTDTYVNELRGNLPYSKICSATKTTSNGTKVGKSCAEGFSGDAFEPIDAYKGDLARTYFYIATRYENLADGWNSPMLGASKDKVFSTWALKLLLSWHNLDPVSTKETNRNNIIYNQLQYNRNPYIDHPELVELIWQI